MLTLAIVYNSTDAHHFLCTKYCVIFGGDVHEISHLILTTDMTTEIPRVKKKKKTFSEPHSQEVMKLGFNPWLSDPRVHFNNH